MGTFGWIIGTTSGTRLAAGSGLVFGFDPRSYHAETYGCLWVYPLLANDGHG
jgi:hypothetical protein